MTQRPALFVGFDSADRQSLWRTDGSVGGTQELTGFQDGPPGSPTDLTPFDAQVLFFGIDASGTYGLWETDGTGAGTRELAGISGQYVSPPVGSPGEPGYTPPMPAVPNGLTLFNSNVLRGVFAERDSSGQNALWVTDGTAAGTQELTGIAGASTAAMGLNPTNFVTASNGVLFIGTDASGATGLWVTDGTVSGTHELTGVAGAPPSGLMPSVLIDGEFIAIDASGQYGLWSTDGTAAGTVEESSLSIPSTDRPHRADRSSFSRPFRAAHLRPGRRQ